MDEVRFSKLENHVESIKDEVTDIKIAQAVMSEKMDNHLERIEDHITGDEKIITEIQPLLRELPSLIEIIKTYEVDKEIAARNKDKKQANFIKYRTLGIKLGYVTTVVGIIATIYRSFF